MSIFVGMHAVAVGAQNFALSYFIQQLFQRDFWVLANTEIFSAFNMVEVQRCGMRVISASRAASLHFYAVNNVTPRLLKLLCVGFFAWGVISAF